VAVPHRLASRHLAWRDRVFEFASSLRKGAHIHVTGYLRSRGIEKKGGGLGKKTGAGEKVPIQTRFVPNLGSRVR